MPLFRLGDRVVLFVHIPRAGGTSVQTYLSRSAESAMAAQEETGALPVAPAYFHRDIYAQLLDPAFYDYAFAITRHPLDRLVSAFLAYADEDASFEAWAEEVFDRYGSDPYLLGNAVRPQSDFLLDGMDTFRLEDGLDKAATALSDAVGVRLGEFSAHEARSPRRPIQLSQSVIRNVTAFYRADFTKLGYEIEASTTYQEAIEDHGPSFSPNDPGNGSDRGLTISMFVPWITQGKGGTETVGTIIANAMSERGHKVHVHTFDDKQGDVTQPLHHEISVTRHPEKPSDVAENQILMSLATQQPDIIVGLYMNRLCFRYVYYGYRLGLPVLLSEHTDPNFADEIGVLERSERERILSAATRIHLLSERFRNELPGHMLERATVIPNTTPMPRQQANPGKIEGTKTVLCVARLVPRKNVGSLISAFAAVDPKIRDNWTLQIVGYGPLKAKLRSQAEELGVRRHIQFEGRQDDTYPYYEDAHIFVLPSFSEAFGLVVLEAMAHGLPSIGFADCSGLEDLIVDGTTGIRVNHDNEIANLSDALTRLMSDSKLRDSMGRSARQAYERIYSPSATLDQWEKLIRATAVEKPPTVLQTDKQVLSQAAILRSLIDGPQHYFATREALNRKKATPETSA